MMTRSKLTLFHFISLYIKNFCLFALRQINKYILFLCVVFYKGKICKFKNKEISYFTLNFKSFYSILKQEIKMKKGFSHFSSMNLGTENSQNNE